MVWEGLDVMSERGESKYGERLLLQQPTHNNWRGPSKHTVLCMLPFSEERYEPDWAIAINHCNEGGLTIDPDKLQALVRWCGKWQWSMLWLTVTNGVTCLHYGGEIVRSTGLDSELGWQSCQVYGSIRTLRPKMDLRTDKGSKLHFYGFPCCLSGILIPRKRALSLLSISVLFNLHNQSLNDFHAVQYGLLCN